MTYPRRMITKTAFTPSGPSPTGSAPGIWRLDEVAYWIKQGVWPDATADQYWSYVAMLMSTTATNAQQNNTFLDSSTNNFTITRNGNTTQGSFTPYGSLWSNYFNGTNAYLTSATSSAYAMGTGDFTIEGWFFTTASGDQALWDNRASTSSAVGIACRLITSTNTLRVILNNTALFTTSQAVTLNQWNHIAIVRASGTVTAYLNGTAMTGGSATGTTNITDTNMWIGKLQDAGFFYNGYISNFRVVKGTAVYTTTFTPPTAPLTAITNTSLLTCQSNRFIDNSTNAFTITVNGNTAVTPFSPFIAPNPGYTAAANGGSGYFDGTGDFLSVPDTAALQMSGSFTWEAWVYPLSLPSGGNLKTFWSQRAVSGGFGGPLVVMDSAGNLLLYIADAAASGWSVVGFDTNLDISLNAWQHIALVKNGSTVTLYKNGTGGTSTTHSTAVGTSGATVIMAGAADGIQTVDGYMSNFRIVKGTAVYTAAFTPPTTPLTAITNTSLLLNFTNAGIFDSATINNMETVGNAQVSTTQAKFGTTSAYFDGTGDYLTFPATQNTAFGTGDFTIEFWVNPSTQVNTYPGLFGNQSFTTNSFVAYERHATYSTKFSVFCYNYSSGAAMLVSTTSVSTNTWYHIAITRSGSTFRLFVNGTVEATATFSGSVDGGVPLKYIGCDYITNQFAGYLDDFRITKGVARYTANFTAPTQAFPTY